MTNETPQTENEAAVLGGWCPCCREETPSLPEPAQGTCAICFGHQTLSCDHIWRAVGEEHSECTICGEIEGP